ncbi:GNAT family N-acetyltransferase [Streptomyces griseoviridis]
MEFRSAAPADEPSLTALWRTAFGDAPVGALWRTDPGRHPRTVVAVEDGRVLSALHWMPRPIRSADGATDRVGCLGGVATRPEARGRGLVTRLLADAVDAMTADRCAWSLLCTGTPDVYRSAGWETFPTPLWHAGLPARPAPPPDTALPRTAGAADTARLAALHDRFDAARPLTTVRTAADWRLRVPHWYDRTTVTLLTDPTTAAAPGADPARPGGYAVARLGPGAAEVLELALAGPDPAARARALLTGIAVRARAAGHRRLTVRAPDVPAVRAAVEAVFPDASAAAAHTGMARPLLASRARVRATVTAPGAVHWFGDSV